MKTTVVILLNLLLTNFLTAGDGDKKIKVPFDSTTNKYTYEKVTQIDSLNSKAFYLKAKKWYIDKYLKSTFLNDSENSRLTQTGSFDISAPLKIVGREYLQSYKVSYNITSQFKDGKCKLVITDFKIANPAIVDPPTLETFQKNNENAPTGRKTWTKHTVLCFEEIDKEVQKIMADFESYLKGSAKTKSDW